MIYGEVVPMPGFILGQHVNKDSHSDGGVWVPRQDQEETAIFRIFHPGWCHSEFTPGDCVLIEPNCGTDFFWDGGETHYTILPVKRVLAKVEHE